MTKSRFSRFQDRDDGSEFGKDRKVSRGHWCQAGHGDADGSKISHPASPLAVEPPARLIASVTISGVKGGGKRGSGCSGRRSIIV